MTTNKRYSRYYAFHREIRQYAVAFLSLFFLFQVIIFQVHIRIVHILRNQFLVVCKPTINLF